MIITAVRRCHHAGPNDPTPPDRGLESRGPIGDTPLMGRAASGTRHRGSGRHLGLESRAPTMEQADADADGALAGERTTPCGVGSPRRRRSTVDPCSGSDPWAWPGPACLPCRSARLQPDPEAPADDRALIVRSQRPLNLETPVAALDHRLTPNDAFFVRSHFGAPAVDLVPWEVELVGLVDRPLRLTLEELGRLEQATKTAVLQCAGNGRALYRPRVPGVPWDGRRRAGGMVGRPTGRAAREGRPPGRCGAPALHRRRCAPFAQDSRVRAQHPPRSGTRPGDDPRLEDERRALAGDPRRARAPGRPGLGG